MDDPDAKTNLYIEEFFPMPKGEMIKNPNEKITLSMGLVLRRIGLKHVVESRKEDEYSLQDIKEAASRIVEIMEYPELDIANTNMKYPDSRIMGRAYPLENRALLVIYQRMGGTKVVYNFFFRDIQKFQKMK